MHRYKVNLDTQTDLIRFVDKATKLTVPVFLTDSTNTFIVNGKSVLGALYAKAEWGELWVSSEKDIYSELLEFISE
jgi:hypothetical protein